MEVSYRPAKFRSIQTWRLLNDVLTTPKGRCLGLREILSASFDSGYSSGYWRLEFKLVADERSISIACTDTFQGEQWQKFFALVFEILRSLHVLKPGISIQQSKARYPTYAAASMGLIAIYVGLTSPIDRLNNISSLLGYRVSAFYISSGLFMIWAAFSYVPPAPKSPACLFEALVVWTKLQPLPL